MRIAVLNAGSATVKAALAEVDAAGVRVRDRAREEVSPREDLASAFERTLRAVGALAEPVAAVVHRVVHGGRDFTGTVRIDGAVEQAIEDLALLAPSTTRRPWKSLECV